MSQKKVTQAQEFHSNTERCLAEIIAWCNGHWAKCQGACYLRDLVNELVFSIKMDAGDLEKARPEILEHNDIYEVLMQVYRKLLTIHWDRKSLKDPSGFPKVEAELKAIESVSMCPMCFRFHNKEEARAGYNYYVARVKEDSPKDIEVRPLEYEDWLWSEDLSWL